MMVDAEILVAQTVADALDIAVLAEPMPWSLETKKAVRDLVLGDVGKILDGDFQSFTPDNIERLRQYAETTFENRVRIIEGNYSLEGSV